MWIGIKTFFPLTELPSLALSTIIYNVQSLTKSQEMANVFNKFFVNVASDIESSIKCS